MEFGTNFEGKVSRELNVRQPTKIIATDIATDALRAPAFDCFTAREIIWSLASSRCPLTPGSRLRNRSRKHKSITG